MNNKQYANKQRFMASYGSSETIDKILNNDYEDHGRNGVLSVAKYDAFQNPSLKLEHITKGLRDENTDVVYAAARSPLATPEHLTAAMDHEDEHIRINAVRNKNSTEEHLKLGMTDPARSVVLHAVEIAHARKLIGPHHVDLLLNHDNPIIRHMALNEPVLQKHITREHLERGAKDESGLVRGLAKKKLAELK